MPSTAEKLDTVFKPAQASVKVKKFVTFDVYPPRTSGGQIRDGEVGTIPVTVPVAKIRRIDTHPWLPNVSYVRLSNDDLCVRGSLKEVTDALNANEAAVDTPKPFALTRRQEQLLKLREEGYSLTQRALAFDISPFRVAQEDAVIDRKLEAANARS